MTKLHPFTKVKSDSKGAVCWVSVSGDVPPDTPYDFAPIEYVAFHFEAEGTYVIMACDVKDNQALIPIRRLVKAPGGQLQVDNGLQQLNPNESIEPPKITLYLLDHEWNVLAASGPGDLGNPPGKVPPPPPIIR